LINKDNYLYIRKNETDICNIMRSINKNLLNCVECCVCYEPKENIKHILCNKCQTPICVKCLPKLNQKYVLNVKLILRFFVSDIIILYNISIHYLIII
jgi:hypothetical protein